MGCIKSTDSSSTRICINIAYCVYPVSISLLIMPSRVYLLLNKNLTQSKMEPLKVSTSELTAGTFCTCPSYRRSDYKTFLLQGIKACPVDEANLFEWEASISGLSDTSWEGGVFRLSLVFDNSYNTRPPNV